jgi:hypothetical protein
MGGEDDYQVGVCEGTQIRLCDEEGNLAAAADAVDCDAGLCNYYYGDGGEDGIVIGACESECEPGERMCLETYYGGDIQPISYYGWNSSAGEQADTPLFVTCTDDGVWDLGDLQVCDDAELCYQLPYNETFDNTYDIVCGGECTPGNRRCFDDVSIETCEEDAQWGDADECDVGVCTDEEEGSVTDARCINECIPGRYATSNVIVDAASVCMLRVCDEGTGTYVPEEDGVLCEFGEECDDILGCFECWGPSYATQRGEIFDAFCDEDGNIVRCGNDNHWADPVGCGNGNICSEAGNDAYTGTTAFCVAEAP